MWASGPDEQAPEAQAIKVVSFLLDAGARVDDRDARGRTALMIAAEGGHAEIANLLLRGSRSVAQGQGRKTCRGPHRAFCVRERLTPR